MRPEYRFALVDFVCQVPAGERRRYEAGHSYFMPPPIAHAAAKRGFVSKRRPMRWGPPGLFSAMQVLSEREMLEADAELKALRRHALEVVER